MTKQPSPPARYADAISALKTAVQDRRLSAAAAANIRRWLTRTEYAELAPLVASHIRESRWQELEEAFWMEIPFGTAGRRGRMYAIGCNAINERTLGETIQALGNYVREVYTGPKPPTCAIAYDTRHHSREFAQLAAEVMVAAGFCVYFFDGFRSAPLLSSTVRYRQCACGIMISASHNPPSDNAVKVFWSHGGQITPPHDEEVTRRIRKVTRIHRFPFASAVEENKIKFCDPAIDAVYRDAVLAEGFHRARGPRNLHILFSPLHGVGLTSVLPVLEADGFEVTVFAPHATPDGNFPHVPGHVANPEVPEVFSAMIAQAPAMGADIILATDPDADRIGCAAPLSPQGDDWTTLTGNQIGVLLAEYILSKKSQADTLTPHHYLVKTLVTTDMLQRVADAYGVKVHGDVLTGFKWIGSRIDEEGPERFLLAVEEAHGYLAGTYTRDKDGGVAAMLLAEAAADAKVAGRTLPQELDRLFLKYGCHFEKTVGITLSGPDGMRRMQGVLAALREAPPPEVGGLAIVRTRDYLRRVTIDADGTRAPLGGPVGDVLVLETELPGTYFAVRPSGTEPKIKFYFFTRNDAVTPGNLAVVKSRLQQRLEEISRDVLARFQLAGPGES